MRLRNGLRLPVLFACCICLLWASSASLRAQTFNLQTDRENITSLDGLWRFHTGDNPAWAMLMALPANAQSAAQPKSEAAPLQIDLGTSVVALTDWKFHPGDSPQPNGANTPAWAQPEYDDSSWTTVDLGGYADSHDPTFSSDTYVPGWTAKGFPTLSGYAWYRTHFRLTGSHRDLWLEMPPNFDDIYQLYVNGTFVGQFGDVTPHHIHDIDSRSTKFKLPPIPAGSDVVVALRFYMDPDTPQWNPLAGGLHSPPVIGLASAITLMQARNSTVNLHTFLAYLLLAFPLAMAGIAALWIYLIDKKEHAYFWLALAFLLGSVTNLAEFLGSQVHWWTISGELLVRDVVGGVLIPVFWLMFWTYWFRLRRLRLVVRVGWTLALLELCAFACMRHYLLASLLPLSWAHPVWLVTVAVRAAFALLLLAVTVSGIRQNPAEGWPALPAIVLLGVGLFFLDLQTWRLPVEFYPLDIRVSADIIAWLVLSIIVIGLVLRRFLHTQVHQRELEQEMKQAQAVQSLLVPTAIPETPGFAVGSVYIPASEVGGDFFQISPEADGSLLIVVGDVSGKGLKAAMTVSTIVGALRGCSLRAPAEVLAYLNRVLHGQIGGFVTCCVTLIAGDGNLTIANAGHLSPYLNGNEMAVPGGLPLGMIPDAYYEELHYQLAPGDRLTFMSDGVVEARNAHGELYGFERTQQISNQPAAAIADTAKRFGQEDDITVVSLVRAT